MPIHQSCKCRLRGFMIAADKPLQQLFVAEWPGRAAMEKRVKVLEYLTRRYARHRIVSRTLDFLLPILVVERAARPFFSDFRVWRSG